jgi:hypothetical protein
MRAMIGHATHDDGCTPVHKHDVFIHEHAQPEASDFGHPCLDPRIVFVVAGDEKGAVPRRQPRQGQRVLGEVGDAAVDQIPGHGNQVRVELVHCIDDRVEVVALDRRADVNVGDLRYREPVQRRGEIRNRHVHPAHAGAPARIEETHERGNRRKGRHGGRAVAAKCTQRIRGKQPSAYSASDKQCHVTQEREDEQ